MNGLDISIDTFKIILFDFDGVLAESANVKTEAFAKLFESFGEDIVRKVVKHHVENGGISRYKKMQYYYSEYLNKPLSEEKLDEIAKKFSEIVVEKVIDAPWVYGVKEFIEKKYKNIDFYVISGTPQKELELIVKKRHMEKYFKGVYGTPETKPDIAKRIIAESRCDPDKVLYIGDSLSDYRDAQEAKIPFLGRVPKGKKSIFPKETPLISDFFDILK